jgi:hypothetical protein
MRRSATQIVVAASILVVLLFAICCLLPLPLPGCLLLF